MTNPKTLTINADEWRLLQQENAQLRVQAAEMAAALRKIAVPSLGQGKGCTICHMRIDRGFSHVEDCFVGQALQSAPTVLFSGEAEARYDAGDGGPMLRILGIREWPASMEFIKARVIVAEQAHESKQPDAQGQ